MSQNWIGTISKILQPIMPLVQNFSSNGYKIYAVGGVVRESVLGSEKVDDLDLTTDALPADIKLMMDPFVSSLWTQGEKFGTIGGLVSGLNVEITTHRGEKYVPGSRKPEVNFSASIAEDLSRRDFTINSIALSLPDMKVIDPYNGLDDLKNMVLRTPLEPFVSFEDDPLRMFRAARFLAKLPLKADKTMLSASRRLLDRVSVLSAERINVELEKMLTLHNVANGFSFLLESGLLPTLFKPYQDKSLSEFAVRLASAEGSVLVRRAGLLYPLEDGALKLLKSLKYSRSDQRETLLIIKCVKQIEMNEISKGLIRRIVYDVGLNRMSEIEQLYLNIESDSSKVSEFSKVFNGLLGVEDLNNIAVPLSGIEIMEHLKLSEGPMIGAVTEKLLDHVLDGGPLTKAEAYKVIDTL